MRMPALLNQNLYITPLAWAMYFTWLVFSLLDWLDKKGLPYKQIMYVAKSGAWQDTARRDSRGLVRATRVMEKGARFMRIEQTYWDRLGRRLAMMGEKTGAREMATILLLRSLLVSLPALALPFFWEGWWTVALYPVAAAVLFRLEMRELDRKYDKWQKELVRDIPEVVDRLRICFAGGRDYLSALRQAQASGGAAMAQALSQLIHDIQTVGTTSAFHLFAVSFDMPAIQKLTSALTLAVESGYGAAEAYFSSIEGEITLLRQEAAEALVKSKPEKVYQLYALLFGLAVATLAMKGWEILNQVGRLFG